MKIILVALSFLILSNSSHAAVCRSVHATNFRIFMATLIAENEYSGSQTSLQVTRGIPVSSTRPGSYEFTRLAQDYLVTSVFCSAGGQCEAEEQAWTLTKNCLYVEGRLVRILNSTGSDLRFDFNDGVRRTTARYFLSSGRRLNIGISRFSSANIEVESFTGIGSK